MFDHPLSWPGSEAVATGSKVTFDAGNATATMIGDTHYVSFCSGKAPDTAVVVSEIAAPAATKRFLAFMKCFFIFLALTTAVALDQEPSAPPTSKIPPQPRESWSAIKLKPDDKPAFPPPPAGWDVKRDDIPHGKLEMISYGSKTVGTRRKMNVYTPPGYSMTSSPPSNRATACRATASIAPSPDSPWVTGRR